MYIYISTLNGSGGGGRGVIVEIVLHSVQLSVNSYTSLTYLFTVDQLLEIY